MAIQSLHINNFRNIKSIRLDTLSSHINLFLGANGSGKTSLLEAIYYLSLGRSFRSSRIENIINKEAEQFDLFASLTIGNQAVRPLGVSKTKKGESTIRLDNDSLSSITPIASLLPVRLVSPHDADLFHCGPQIRRRWLDWGVFHVKHNFIHVWRDYQRALKQRNECLKARRPMNEVRLWNQSLVPLGNQLTTYRREYIEKLKETLPAMLENLYDIKGLSLTYAPGWDAPSETLEQALEKHILREQALGYTLSGPHRGDLKILINRAQAADKLSRGQQKIISATLQLCQGKILEDETEKSCTYLIDDIGSELDQDFQERFMAKLFENKGQFFITALTETPYRKYGKELNQHSIQEGNLQ